MTAPIAAAKPVAPRVNPLQRIWLREIGMERLWMRPAPAAARPAVVPQAPVSEPVLAPGLAPAVVARDIAPATVPPTVASPAPAVPQAVAVSAAPAEPVVPTKRSNGRPGIPASILNRTGPPPRPVPKAAEDEAVEAPRIPVAQAVKNATLDELREQVVACTACGLCDGRRHAVFGPSLRGPVRPIAGRHAGRRGHEPRDRRVHHQRDQVPPAGHPRPQAQLGRARV
ncbi:hypothetical protein G6F35_015214 [Rhizopus arrhizus]|nr:hypothetical protein G6F35_015214 [Rhizopus arrhizus]